MELSGFSVVMMPRCSTDVDVERVMMLLALEQASFASSALIASSGAS